MEKDHEKGAGPLDERVRADRRPCGWVVLFGDAEDRAVLGNVVARRDEDENDADGGELTG